MEAAEVWSTFGAQIHQDFLTEYPDLWSGFRFLFDNLSAVEREELHSFLVQLLATKPSPVALAEIWYGSGAEPYVSSTDMPDFFSELIRSLEESLARSGSPPR